MAKLQRQNLDDPAVQRRLPRMDVSFARVGPISVGRARLKPGWRWSIDSYRARNARASLRWRPSPHPLHAISTT